MHNPNDTLADSQPSHSADSTLQSNAKTQKARDFLPMLDIPQENLTHLGFLNELIEHIETLGFLNMNLASFTLEVIALDSADMRKLNSTHRGKDTTTDVLSFPLCCDMFSESHTLTDMILNENLEAQEYKGGDSNESMLPLCLGSVVINYELAEQVAKKHGHSAQDEISLLFIHGLLHILGFDHEVDNGEQRTMEQRIIESLGLKESLIVREMG